MSLFGWGKKNKAVVTNGNSEADKANGAGKAGDTNKPVETPVKAEAPKQADSANKKSKDKESKDKPGKTSAEYGTSSGEGDSTKKPNDATTAGAKSPLLRQEATVGKKGKTDLSNGETKSEKFPDNVEYTGDRPATHTISDEEASLGGRKPVGDPDYSIGEEYHSLGATTRKPRPNRDLISLQTLEDILTKGSEVDPNQDCAFVDVKACCNDAITCCDMTLFKGNEIHVFKGSAWRRLSPGDKIRKVDRESGEITVESYGSPISSPIYTYKLETHLADALEKGDVVVGNNGDHIWVKKNQGDVQGNCSSSCTPESTFMGCSWPLISCCTWPEGISTAKKPFLSSCLPSLPTCSCGCMPCQGCSNPVAGIKDIPIGSEVVVLGPEEKFPVDTLGFKHQVTETCTLSGPFVACLDKTSQVINKEKISWYKLLATNDRGQVYAPGYGKAQFSTLTAPVALVIPDQKVLDQLCDGGVIKQIDKQNGKIYIGAALRTPYRYLTTSDQDRIRNRGFKKLAAGNLLELPISDDNTLNALAIGNEIFYVEFNKQTKIPLVGGLLSAGTVYIQSKQPGVVVIDIEKESDFEVLQVSDAIKLEEPKKDSFSTQATVTHTPEVVTALPNSVKPRVKAGDFVVGNNPASMLSSGTMTVRNFSPTNHFDIDHKSENQVLQIGDEICDITDGRILVKRWNPATPAKKEEKTDNTEETTCVVINDPVLAKELNTGDEVISVKDNKYTVREGLTKLPGDNLRKDLVAGKVSTGGLKGLTGYLSVLTPFVNGRRAYAQTAFGQPTDPINNGIRHAFGLSLRGKWDEVLDSTWDPDDDLHDCLYVQHEHLEEKSKGNMILGERRLYAFSNADLVKLMFHYMDLYIQDKPRKGDQVIVGTEQLNTTFTPPNKREFKAEKVDSRTILACTKLFILLNKKEQIEAKLQEMLPVIHQYVLHGGRLDAFNNFDSETTPAERLSNSNESRARYQRMSQAIKSAATANTKTDKRAAGLAGLSGLAGFLTGQANLLSLQGSGFAYAASSLGAGLMAFIVFNASSRIKAFDTVRESSGVAQLDEIKKLLQEWEEIYCRVLNLCQGQWNLSDVFKFPKDLDERVKQDLGVVIKPQKVDSVLLDINKEVKGNKTILEVCVANAGQKMPYGKDEFKSAGLLVEHLWSECTGDKLKEADLDLLVATLARVKQALSAAKTARTEKLTAYNPADPSHDKMLPELHDLQRMVKTFEEASQHIFANINAKKGSYKRNILRDELTPIDNQLGTTVVRKPEVGYATGEKDLPEPRCTCGSKESSCACIIETFCPSAVPRCGDPILVCCGVPKLFEGWRQDKAALMKRKDVAMSTRGEVKLDIADKTGTMVDMSGVQPRDPGQTSGFGLLGDKESKAGVSALPGLERSVSTLLYSLDQSANGKGDKSKPPAEQASTASGPVLRPAHSRKQGDKTTSEEHVDSLHEQPYIRRENRV